MTLLHTLIGEHVHAFEEDVVRQIEQNILGYVEPHLHPEDLMALAEAVEQNDSRVIRSVVQRYGIGYDVHVHPHIWSVRTPWNFKRS